MRCADDCSPTSIRREKVLLGLIYLSRISIFDDQKRDVFGDWGIASSLLLWIGMQKTCLFRQPWVALPLASWG